MHLIVLYTWYNHMTILDALSYYSTRYVLYVRYVLTAGGLSGGPQKGGLGGGAVPDTGAALPTRGI